MSRSSDSRRHSAPGEEFRDNLPRHVLDNLLEGCQIISPDYRYLYVNHTVARHGRTTRERLLGRTMAEVYPGIEETAMFALLRQCMEERSPQQMENEFTFPDGSKGWFDLRFEPVPDGVFVLSMEITQRKRAEAAMLRANRALTVLSECNQSLVRATEEQQLMEDVCRIIVEKGAFRMAWIEIESSAGRRSAELTASAGADERHLELIRQMQAESERDAGPMGRAQSTGHTVIRSFSTAHSELASWNETARDLGLASCIALPVRGNHEHLGVLTIFSTEADAFDAPEQRLLEEMALDLGYGIKTLKTRTARERAEEKLAHSQARYRELVANLDDVVFSADTDGRIRFASPAVQRCFGYTPEEVVGRRFSELVHPDDLRGLSTYLERVLTGAADSHEFRGFDKDGQVRYLRTNCRLRLEGGRPVGVDGVVVDFTEQRAIEEQLKLSQRLEAVARLAGGVAHDFNNMLSVIINCASFALDEMSDSDSAKKHILQVRNAGERAATLTRQLLAFSRKQVLQPEVLNLNTVVDDIGSMLRRLLGEDVAITLHLAEDLGNVNADPGQLEQVLMNLAVNARDAMPQGGSLTIETANVELDEEYTSRHISMTPGRFVMLSVSDTGSGMDETTREHIFDPFFTTKEKGKGTGLGLSTVYGIVKQSSGNIWVYSEPGRGTTFKVYLPLSTAPTRVARRREGSTIVDGNETILLVEDEPLVREVTEYMLKKAGYRILSAPSGPEALRLCEKHGGRIDLLLTDVVMPQMSGTELSERLAKINPGLKTLYMSGYTDNAIVHHGVLDQGVSFVGKPFSTAELTRKVREVLDGAPK